MSYFLITDKFELPAEFRAGLDVSQKGLIASKLANIAFVTAENAFVQLNKVGTITKIGVIREVIDWTVANMYCVETQADADALVAVLTEVATENQALRGYEIPKLSSATTEITPEEWTALITSGSPNLVFDVPPAFA